MYNQIASNKRKTYLLISLFSVLILLLGVAFGEQTDNPGLGITFAVMVATTMSLFSYFVGDKVALMTAGARQITKEQAPELWRIVENLSIAGGVPMPRVYIIEDEAPNAFATGRKPAQASIAVTTGLLRILEKNELEGVIAHELSHVKNYDILVMTVVIILVGAITLLADILLRTTILGKGNNREGAQVTIVLFLIGLVLSILSPLFAEIIKLAISRQREYLADASGALLTRYPEGLAKALEKIALYNRPMKHANHATAHLFIASPFGPGQKMKKLFSTHPPIEERIKRLRTMGG